MKDMQIFSHDQFGKIRVIEVDGEPWFVAVDVCRALEVLNPSDALKRLDEDERARFNLGHPMNETNCVNEPGLYSLVLGSRKPEAKFFKRWVTHDVLPTIRKTGGYVANDDLFVNTYLPFADSAIQDLFKLNLSVIRQQNELIASQGRQLEEQKPLVEFANHVGDTSDLFTMSQLAKLAQNEHIPLGRNKLYKWLREKKYLRENNEPYQQYVTMGIFKVKDVVKTSPYGANVFPTTFVTGKGQIYLVEKLRAEFCGECSDVGDG